MDISALPPQVQPVVEKLLHTYDIALPGGFSISPNLLQAILIVILIFLLIFTLGHLRHTYVDWSVKGILPGLTFGFVLAILVEGLFLIAGKTLFTEVLGWKNAPKPISNVLDASREKIVSVLGAESQVPSSNAATSPTSQSVLTEIKNLTKADQDKLKLSLCTPSK